MGGGYLLVAILHPRDELLEEEPGLVLAEPARLDDAVKQLPARRVLHGNSQVGGRQEHLPMALCLQRQAKVLLLCYSELTSRMLLTTPPPPAPPLACGR